MILADTSVWVQHFRQGLPALAKRLSRGQIATHSVVIGELAAGNLTRRRETLSWLGQLPRAEEATSAECLAFLEQHELFGLGIGWSDVQLLAAAQRSRIPIWSLDKKMTESARQLRLA
jgi:predicted nucleic acid-binding protein